MLTSSPDGIPVLEKRNVVARRFALALGFVVIVGGVFLLLARDGGSDRLIGAGSTFAYPLIQRASAAYQDAKADGGDWVPGSTAVDYEPVGSLGGILRLRDAEVDFAVSDYPLSTEEAAKANYVQFPIVIGSIVPIYNLGAATAAPLKLRAATLADIYLGKITNWSDPAIQAANPGVALPDLPIRVVHRAEGSGSTLNWTTYLAQGSPAWQADHGAKPVIDWPTGLGVRGSAAMAEAVKTTPGSIGYLEAGQARRADLTVAEVENGQGHFVAATPAAVEAAARGLAGATDARVTATDPDAYPIATAAYVIMKRANMSAADNARALRFLGFILDQRAADAKALGYLPLPRPLVESIKRVWARELVRNS